MTEEFYQEFIKKYGLTKQFNDFVADKEVEKLDKVNYRYELECDNVTGYDCTFILNEDQRQAALTWAENNNGDFEYAAEVPLYFQFKELAKVFSCKRDEEFVVSYGDAVFKVSRTGRSPNWINTENTYLLDEIMYWTERQLDECPEWF